MAKGKNMKISGYDVKAGMEFAVGGRKYKATKDARGEFRPHIMVEDPRTKSGESEIILFHDELVDTEGPEFSPEKPLPVTELRTDGDRSRKYIMRCKNHPNLQYRSKDPHASSIFASQPGTCDCTYHDLEVIGRER